jgi:hypothetical protein
MLVSRRLYQTALLLNMRQETKEDRTHGDIDPAEGDRFVEKV